LQRPPIDLATAKATDVSTPFTLDYQGGALELVNHGHTIQADTLQEINTLNHDGLPDSPVPSLRRTKRRGNPCLELAEVLISGNTSISALPR
jgi:hypothetical protein